MVFQPHAWLTGLLPVALLAGGSLWWKQADIERDLQARAEARVAARTTLDGKPWATVTVAGRDVTITGTAPAQDAFESAADTADEAFGVRRAVVPLGVGLIPSANPFGWSARRDDNAISLSGHVAPDGSRARIVETARAAVPGGTVDDAMVAVRGVPEAASAAAIIGVQQLGRVSTGSATLSGGSFSFAGTPVDEAAGREIAAALERLPAGIARGTVRLAAPQAPEPPPPGVADPPDPPPAPAPPAATADAASPPQAPPAAATDAAPAAPAPPMAAAPASPPASVSVPAVPTPPVAAAPAPPPASESTPAAPASPAAPAAAAPTPPAAAPTPPPAPAWSAAKGADGVLTLSGTVASEEARARLIDGAMAATPGPVIDAMTVTPGLPEAVEARAAALLADLGRLAEGRVSIDGTRLSLSGTAASPEAFDQIRGAAREAVGGFSFGEVAVAPPVVSPFTWSARREGGTLRLSGHAPSEAAKAALAGLGGSLTVVDDTRLASGLPEGIDFGRLAAAVAAQLEKLSDGRADLSGTRLAVTGRAPDFDTAAGIREALAGLGAPLTVVSDISLPPAEVPPPAEPAPLSADLVAPPPISPYTWSAQREGGTVRLSGHAPSQEAKAALAGLGGSLTVVDDTRLASGLPEGIDFGRLAATVVAQLEKLPDGRADLSGTRLTVTGRAPDFDTAAGIRAALAGLGAPLTVVSDVTLPPAEMPPPAEPPALSPDLAAPPQLETMLPPVADLPLPAIPPAVPAPPADPAASGAPPAPAVSAAPPLPQPPAQAPQPLAAPLPQPRADSSAPPAPAGTGEAAAPAPAAPAPAPPAPSSPAPSPPAPSPPATGEAPAAPAAPTPPAAAPAPPPAQPGTIPPPAAPAPVVLPPPDCTAVINTALEGDRILFDYWKAEQRAEHGPILDRLAAAIRRCDPAERIEVAGHADIRNRTNSNQQLSEDRAAVVRDELVRRGIPAERLVVVGYAASRPVVPNDSEENMALNRRVELHVLPRN